LIALAFRIKLHGTYSFSANENIPLYMFLSVVVAIFLGLVLSAGEILKERNMLEKEEYLEFSRFSYINSKILYLFPVIALQTFLYVWTGNFILGIRDMFWVYWAVLFSSACFGVLIGLTSSASVLDSEVLFKRILPIVIALQVLLGGGLIPYERINLGNGKFTPVLGDLMVSRWGYEALAVKQYTDNRFQKLVFDMDKKVSQASYYSLNVIPRLQESLTRCVQTTNKDSIELYSSLLKNEMVKTRAFADIFPFEYINDLADIKKNENLAQETSDYLTYISLHFYDQYNGLVKKKSRLLDSLSKSLGKGVLAGIRKNNFNQALENAVTNKNYPFPYSLVGKELIRTKDNIFQEPVSNFGRARLFCPMKQLNGQKTKTVWFNLSVMWMFTAVCYLLLLFDAVALIRKVHPSRWL
jgi:hypothetical protein